MACLPRPLRIAALLALVVCLAVPAATSRADSFSLFGVRFGMTREEIGRVWNPLGEDGYAIPSSPLRQVTGTFDKKGRLVRLSFTFDLAMNDPFDVIQKAIQQMVDHKWGRDQEIANSLVIGRAETIITVWNRRLLEEYVQSVEEQVSILLKP